mgnify:CR=1 FL=1
MSNLALAAFQQEEYARSIEWCDKTLQVSPDNAKVREHCSSGAVGMSDVGSEMCRAAWSYLLLRCAVLLHSKEGGWWHKKNAVETCHAVCAYTFLHQQPMWLPHDQGL